jgi:hypothetical protein
MHIETRSILAVELSGPSYDEAVGHVIGKAHSLEALISLVDIFGEQQEMGSEIRLKDVMSHLDEEMRQAYWAAKLSR